jgi:hypothetical protein
LNQTFPPDSFVLEKSCGCLITPHHAQYVYNVIGGFLRSSHCLP